MLRFVCDAFKTLLRSIKGCAAPVRLTFDDLDGGVGRDTLSGGQGADTYRWGLASGSDRIQESGSIVENDTLVLAAGIQPAALSLIQDGNDLVLMVGQSNVQLEIAGYFVKTGSNGASTDNQVENFRFSDGTVWSSAQIQSRIVSGTPNAMVGGAGNNTFNVDSAADTVTEAAGQGTDTIISTVSYTLPNNVENLTVMGYLNAKLAGNDLNNVLTGNAGDNVFNAHFSSPQPGYLGLNIGLDTLIGGAGDDLYYVTYGETNGAVTTSDTVVENLNEGIDTIDAFAYNYTLPNNVENLIGHTDVVWSTPLGYVYPTYVGNSLDNVISAKAGYYGVLLDGGAGADTLQGGPSGDVYVVDNPGDVVDDSHGSSLYGPPSSSTNDTVRSSISYMLGADIENLQLTGAAAITLSRWLA